MTKKPCTAVPGFNLSGKMGAIVNLPEKMQAVVGRGGQLVLASVPIPGIEPDGVLLEVLNVGFCGSDHSLIKSGGLPEDTILGHEVCGRVVACGSGVRDVALGSRAIVRPTSCGQCRDCQAGRPYFCQTGRRSIGIGDMPGAFAEYVKVYPDMLIPVPDEVDSRNAALAEAFAAALHGINCIRVSEGPALVMGGGPIGLATVNLLHIMGISPIVLSEPVEIKRRLARELGADHVLDPFGEEMGTRVFEMTSGIGFPAVFECAGVPDNIQKALDWVARGGDICVVSMMFAPAPIVPMTLNFKEARLTGCYSNTHAENRKCLEWMAAGRLDGRPLVTDVVSLAQLPAVFRERIDTGQAIKVLVETGAERF
jgi:threonine dehydrogenase-like Zn-dependent dehydrogenase